MSRSGYSEDLDNWQLIRWRGAVESAINGKRGQAFLKEMIIALDAMPEKRLIADKLTDGKGSVCAIGSVGAARKIEMQDLDVYDHETLSKVFGIANAMVCEIENQNDGYYYADDFERWQKVRKWCVNQLKELK